jgi:hypothetical protein
MTVQLKLFEVKRYGLYAACSATDLPDQKNEKLHLIIFALGTCPQPLIVPQN